MRKNGNCLENNSSLHQLSREDFSYPNGSWFLKPNLNTIHNAINDFDDFWKLKKINFSTKTFKFNWSQIPVGKLEQRRTSNSICTAPTQIVMLNNPPQKFSDEYCVSLADWDASGFKTVSVNRTDKPKYVAAQAVFLAYDEADFINNDMVF